MNKYVVIVLGIIATACVADITSQETKKIKKEKKPVKVESTVFHLNDGIHIVEHDSCQYIYLKTNYSAGLTHKGNCKFCLERSKSEN